MISIELVPRSHESLRADLASIAAAFPSVRMLNIPDLLRFELRSWDACALALAHLDRAVPHIRAMDFAMSEVPTLARQLAGLGLKEALIIRGDTPQDLGRPMHSTSSVELIRELLAVDPELRLYAALDPYRRSMSEELDSVREKLDAGAVGLFTQPFFDLRLLEVYRDLLSGIEVFWGVSPVVGAKSQRYWEVKNRVVFPRNFQHTLEFSRSYAKACLEFARMQQASLYFMPIRTSLTNYLGGLL